MSEHLKRLEKYSGPLSRTLEYSDRSMLHEYRFFGVASQRFIGLNIILHVVCVPLTPLEIDTYLALGTTKSA